jgi:hypothetical protein
MWEHAIDTIPRWKRILNAPSVFWCYSGLRDGLCSGWRHIMIGYYMARIYMGKK